MCVGKQAHFVYSAVPVALLVVLWCICVMISNKRRGSPYSALLYFVLQSPAARKRAEESLEALLKINSISIPCLVAWVQVDPREP